MDADFTQDVLIDFVTANFGWKVLKLAVRQKKFL
jgi:hypothetical protein